eukprot:CAMPEP_0198731974 /NCGR_PEP_ID=MMETSP1475-20131203/33114_1 /TAXON_ID= ORGANISM="Unidentified sp., Strain CCMP1999" /NCGR_SAMPLE_ID=MMETSP1475 /ASSEMBLY_ACC=CAM_ASM_001111 /LENGTH=286 /DNA_ID=CAMNT_0044495003 /DNA_START=200 /DNA_END=1057 /DNA_ORIENTATION=-
MKKPKNQALAGVVGIGGVFYYTSHLDYAPYTNRRRMIDISREYEQELGEQQFAQLKRQLYAQMESPNSMHTRRIQKIGMRLAAVSGQDDYDWEFVVFQKPEPNAFCLPGGKIGVFSGLLDLARTDDELAAVLAHEVGHAIARHGAERLSAMTILLPLRLLLNFIIDTYLLNSLIISLIFELPLSRKNELEADYIGLQLMTKACFDPRGSPEIFTKLGQWAKKQSVRVPEYLSTHPADDKRVQGINKILPEAMDRYEQSCTRQTISFAKEFFWSRLPLIFRDARAQR